MEGRVFTEPRFSGMETLADHCRGKSVRQLAPMVLSLNQAIDFLRVRERFTPHFSATSRLHLLEGVAGKGLRLPGT
jgi:hypothetical protein